jgi:hypothetical protein
MKYKHFRSSLLYVCCNFLSNFSFDSFEKVWAVLCDFSLKHTFNPSGSNVIYDGEGTSSSGSGERTKIVKKVPSAVEGFHVNPWTLYNMLNYIFSRFSFVGFQARYLRF